MTEPILHHYPVSPFAEKVRAMLGFKRLAWKSVQIPIIMPKPDVVALPGRAPLHEGKANMQGLLKRIEAQLEGPSLFGAEACVADFSLYHVLWPIWKVDDTRPMLALYPKTQKFIERIAAIGHGKSTEISSGDALQIARSSTPEAVKGAVALETGGIALGERAQVMPVDSGLDPVTGELLSASAGEIVLRRSDPRAGTGQDRKGTRLHSSR